MPKPTFKEWIYDKGYNLKDLADAIKVHRVTLYFWMKGTRTPFPRHMMRIKMLSKGLFTKPEDLLDKKPGRNESNSKVPGELV